jgi:hypothetical protein
LITSSVIAKAKTPSVRASSLPFEVNCQAQPPSPPHAALTLVAFEPLQFGEDVNERSALFGPVLRHSRRLLRRNCRTAVLGAVVPTRPWRESLCHGSPPPPTQPALFQKNIELSYLSCSNFA